MDVETTRPTFTKKRTKARVLIGLVLGAIIVIALVAVIIGVTVPIRSLREADAMERANKLLAETPLVDGHNDMPWQIFNNAKNQLEAFNMEENLETVWASPVSKIYSQTDITRLKKGKLGGQFWVSFASCKTQFQDSVRMGLEQLDVIKRFINYYPDTFQFVTTAAGITEAFKNGKIASLLALEGGHMIDSSLATLRLLYDIGVRYMTITHNCNTPWADTVKTHTDADDFPSRGGLTDFGKLVIKEMNRLGMVVDLSHTSFDAQRAVLNVSESPVIFSHSSAFALCANYRNVPDDVLRRMPENGGIVMVNFYNPYISCEKTANVSQVADHIEHIRDMCGTVDCVGIGADYDGVDLMPEGLRDVSEYPNLFVELITRGWKDEDLKKLASGNIIRVLQKNEEIRDKKLRDKVKPTENVISESQTSNNTCRTPFHIAITW